MSANLDGDLALLARVRARVMEAVAREPLAHHTVRADAGHWDSIGPGVERKLLWERGDAACCMLRLAPGTAFPPHNHEIDEECMVLEGSMRIGPDLLLRAGDFHVGRQGVEHESIATEEGCLCFLRTARSFFEPAA